MKKALARKYRVAVQYSPIHVLTQAQVHVNNGKAYWQVHLNQVLVPT